MKKGQSTTISTSSVQLPHGTSLVLVPVQNGHVVQEDVKPLFKSRFSPGGVINLKDLEGHAEKVHVISSTDTPAFFIDFNNTSLTVDALTEAQVKIRVIATLYLHNSQWKIRFVDELISDNQKLGAYLKALTPIDYLAMCSEKHDAVDSLRNQASSIINARGSSDVKKGLIELGGGLKSEGVSLFNKMRGKLNGKIKKVKNESFLEAACAVSAMVAFADGFASPEEQAKLLVALQSTDELSIYPSKEVSATFQKYVSVLKDDKLMGEGHAVKSIVSFAGKPEAEFLVFLAVGIASAEGGVDQDEREVITRIGSKLGVSTNDLLGRV